MKGMKGMKGIGLAVLIFALLVPVASRGSPPPAPTWISVSERVCSFGTRSVYVDWIPVEGADAYRIWLDGAILRSNVPVQHGGEGIQHYTHWWVEEGRTYTYYVTALAAGEESGPSPTGVITTSECDKAPSQPQDLVVVPTSCKTTIALWTPSDGGAWPLFAYMIRRSGADDLEEMTERGSARVFRDWVWNPPSGTPEPPNYYFDDGESGSIYGDKLEGGKTFYYSVQAYNWMANASTPSAVFEVAMPPCP